MNYVPFVGYLAAALTTFAFLPQALKIIKTKSTEDLSLITYTCMSLGLLIWLIYGLLLWDNPIIYANGIALIIASVILFYIIRDRTRK